MKYFDKILRIGNVEYAVTSEALPGWSKKRLSIAMVYAIIVLGLFIFILRDMFDEPMHLMASVAVFIVSVTYIFSFFNMLQFSSLPYRQWWLTLPYPRHVIVYARMVTVLRAMLSISVPIMVGGMVYYFIAVDRWGMQSISFETFIAKAAGFIVLLGVAAPMIIALGFLVTTLYRGWVRWVYIVPYFLLTAMSFSAVTLVELIDVQLLSTSNLFTIALIGLVVGWPLAFLLLNYISNAGMYNMANVNSSADKMNIFLNKRSKKKNRIKINPEKRGYTTLYQLERSRYTHIGSMRLIRILLYVTLFIIAFVAYISAMKIGSMNVLGFIAFLATFPLIMPIFWSMMISTAEVYKNRIDWWLSFPYARLQLVVARNAAIWVTAMRQIVLMSIVFWVATIVASLIHSSGTEHLRLSLAWFAYGFMLYMSSMTISMMLLQIQSYLTKTKGLALLIIPLNFLIFFQPFYMLHYFLPFELGKTPYYPDWTWLILLIVIGLPLGLISMRLGAKHLHDNYYTSQQSPAIAQGKK